MPFKDLQDSSKPWPDDNDYFKVTVVDLDPNKSYPFQFRWQYEDKTYGPWSATREITTKSYTVPEVANVVTSWKGTTLTISFDRPEALVNGVMKNRAKDFIITLTYNSKTKTVTIPADTSKTAQTYVLTEEEARQFWRDVNDAKFFPTAYTGLIKTVTLDQFTSTGVSFNTTAYNDGITNQPITDASWALVAAVDGYNVTFSEFTNVNDVELYYETEVWESSTSGGTYTKVAARSRTPISRPYYGDLTTKYVKIRHATKKGTFSQYSNVKNIASINPGGYDATAPSNTQIITAGTPVVDGNGLFDFNYKVPFSWTAESDTTTLGYRIRWRPVNTNNTPITGSEQYTNTVVPGRLTTTTYLYGVLAGQKYEVGKNTYDEYGNTDQTIWQTTYVTIPAFTGTISGSKFLQAGDMKLGYGIGGRGGTADTNVNLNKGLYLGSNNYWYITGNTVTDSGSYLKVGSADSNMIFDGTNLSVTGTINALAGDFTGSINVGKAAVGTSGQPGFIAAVPGQLRVIGAWNGSTVTGAVEIGKFSQAYTVSIAGGGTVTSNFGIYAYGPGGKYSLIDGTTGTIYSNAMNGSTITGSVFQTPNYGTTALNKGGMYLYDSTNGDGILWSTGDGTVSKTSASIVGVAGGLVLSGWASDGTVASAIAITDSGIVSLQAPSGSPRLSVTSSLITSSVSHSFSGTAQFSATAYNTTTVSITGSIFRNIAATTTTGYPTSGTGVDGEIILVREA